MDENSGNNQSDNADNDSGDDARRPAGEPLQADDERQIERTQNANGETTKKRNMRLGHKWDKVSLPNKINIWLTAIIGFATVVNAVVAIKQSSDGDKLIEAANSINAATKENVRQNKDAMQAATDFFKLNLRPAVTVATVDFVKPPMIGQPLFVRVRVVNSGRSPALRFRGHIHAESGRLAIKSVGKGGAFPPSGAELTLAAERETAFSAFTLSDPSDERSEPVPWNGSRPIVVWGEFEYWDHFGKRYTTSFCRERVDRVDAYFLANCRIYNKAE